MEQKNHTSPVEQRVSERDIKKYTGPYDEQKLQSIISEIQNGTNTVVFVHNRGVKEIVPLNVNFVTISDGIIHICFKDNPTNPIGKMDIPITSLELVTQYQ